MKILFKMILISFVLQSNAHAQTAAVKVLDNGKAIVDCTVEKMLDGQHLAISGRSYEVNLNERTTVFQEQQDLKDIQIEVLVSSEESPYQFQIRISDKKNLNVFSSRFSDGKGQVYATLSQAAENQFQSLNYHVTCGDK